MMPSENFEASLCYYPLYLSSTDERLKEKFFRLSRGEPYYNPHPYSPGKWKEIFKKSGLEVTSYKYLLSKSLMEFWDTGLRPFSRKLIKISRLLDELGIKRIVKSKVVDRYEKYLQMYIDTDCAYTGEKDGAFLLIVAERMA